MAGRIPSFASPTSLSVDFNEQDPGVQKRFQQGKDDSGNKPIEPVDASNNHCRAAYNVWQHSKLIQNEIDAVSQMESGLLAAPSNKTGASSARLGNFGNERIRFRLIETPTKTSPVRAAEAPTSAKKKFTHWSTIHRLCRNQSGASLRPTVCNSSCPRSFLGTARHLQSCP